MANIETNVGMLNDSKDSTKRKRPVGNVLKDSQNTSASALKRQVSSGIPSSNSSSELGPI